MQAAREWLQDCTVANTTFRLHSCEIVLTATGNLNQSTSEIHQLFEIEMNVDADLDADGLGKLEKFVEDQCAIGTLLKQENEVKPLQPYFKILKLEFL